MVASPQIIFSAQQEGHVGFYQHPIKLRYEASAAICFAESWLAMCGIRQGSACAGKLQAKEAAITKSAHAEKTLFDEAKV